jgi:membrane protease YdiL (CAAX protease family)
VTTEFPAERPLKLRIASLAGLVFALVVPAILTAGGPGEMPGGTNAVDEVLVSEATMWSLTLIVLGIVLFGERRSLTSLGLGRPTWPAIRTGIMMTVLLLVLAMGAGAIVQAVGGMSGNSGNQIDLVVGLPIWLQLVVALSAGFTEELLFRGYAITRTTELTGNRWLGAIIPIIVFGAVHAPFWGVGHAVVAGMSGLWLTLIYQWRRDLWTNITAHALLDLLVFVSVDLIAATGAVAAN